MFYKFKAFFKTATPQNLFISFVIPVINLLLTIDTSCNVLSITNASDISDIIASKVVKEINIQNNLK